MNSRERFEQFYEDAASANFSAPIVGDYYECIIKDTAYSAFLCGIKDALKSAMDVCLEASFKANSLESSKAAHACAEQIRQMMEE